MSNPCKLDQHQVNNGLGGRCRACGYSYFEHALTSSIPRDEELEDLAIRIAIGVTNENYARRKLIVSRYLESYTQRKVLEAIKGLADKVISFRSSGGYMMDERQFTREWLLDEVEAIQRGKS